MKQQNYYIIDFDSTFTQVEALDELARISLNKHPNKEAIFKKIEDYTNLAMEGKLSFSESLAQRVKLLEATEDHLKQLITRLKKKVSSSFSRNATFFKKHADEVLIVSGGFKEFMGRSGFAVVYRSKFEHDDEVNHRLVALKVLRWADASTSDQRVSFREVCCKRKFLATANCIEI